MAAAAAAAASAAVTSSFQQQKDRRFHLKVIPIRASLAIHRRNPIGVSDSRCLPICEPSRDPFVRKSVSDGSDGYTGGGSGNNGNSSGGGGGGNGGSGGGDGGMNRREAILALAAAGRSLENLPADLAAAVEAGRIPGSIIERFVELEKSPLLRWLMQFGGFKERLLADDLFLAKVAMECGVGVFTKVHF